MAENNSSGAEEIKQKKLFDMGEAFNTAGFVEFMARKDTDAESPEAVEADFELFNDVKVVKEGLRKLYREQIAKDFGILLNTSDLNTIEEHLEKQAVDSPEEIGKLKEKLEIFREIPGQIQQLEEQLGQLGKVEDLSKKLDELRKDQETLTRANKYSGFGGTGKYIYAFLKVTFKGFAHLKGMVAKTFNPEFKTSEAYDKYAEEKTQMSADRKAIKEVSEEHGSLGRNKINKLLEGVNVEISKIEEALSRINTGKELKIVASGMFENARKELLGGVSGISELTQIIQRKATEGLKKLIDNPSSIKDIERAQEMLEGLDESSGKSETGIDPFEGNDEEEIQKKIDKAIERQIIQAITEIVLQAKLTKKDGDFAKLEKTLSQFTEKEKIGSKEGDEARIFIISALEEASNGQEQTIEGKAKRLMLAQIIRKMRNK